MMNENCKNTVLSQALRKNMTKEEKHLWYDFLKYLPQTIQRQRVMGNYIVDFYCAESDIVIELNGSQHTEPDAVKSDRIRDQFFKRQGITVLRYSNSDINQKFDDVCMDILQHIEKADPLFK